MKYCVIIPSYNEKDRLIHVVEEVSRYTHDIIVVDDGSNHAEPLARLQRQFSFVHLLRHAINLGKGAALKTGCDAAIALGAESVILMDSDGQHRAEDIPRFLEALERGYDIVYGYREIGGDMPFMMRLGNFGISLATRVLFGVHLRDTQSGFRAFRLRQYPFLRWESSRYAVETEMIVNAAKRKLRFTQIPIHTIYHDKYKGTTVFDGVRIFWSMILWRFT